MLLEKEFCQKIGAITKAFLIRKKISKEKSEL